MSIIPLHENSMAYPVKDKNKWSYMGEQHNVSISPRTPDVSPKSSKVGAFLPRPPPFREKNSVSVHQKSRKGTNLIRPNDVIPSLFLVRSEIIVVTTLYSDAPSVQTRKNNHPSLVSKLGWLYVYAPIYWYKLWLPFGQIQGVQEMYIRTPCERPSVVWKPIPMPQRFPSSVQRAA